MPVFRNGLAFEIARGIRVFLNVEAGATRNRALEPEARPDASKAPGASRQTGARARKPEPVGRRMPEQGREPGRATGSSMADGARGVNPENMIWIFGVGRTGSSWLARMMGELEGHAVWFEPWVGALFDPHHLRLGERKGKQFILAPQYKDTWLRSIRSFVLDGAGVRFPELTEGDHLVIKDPGGSSGAPLLMEALPESRMILLIRDPRDVVASWVDARKEDTWLMAGRGPSHPADEVVREVAKRYLRQVGQARLAYEAHEGRKALVRYEELRADTLGTMRRIYSTLGIPMGEGELRRAVEKRAWEAIPEGEKGEGKFFRKAKPGSWREDLTLEQAKTVEGITGPLLKEFYPDGTAG